MIRRHYLVTGRVQGVGFRKFTAREASKAGVKGGTRNLNDGRVEIVAYGTPTSLEIFEHAISRGPLLSSVRHLEKRDLAEPLIEETDFVVLTDGEKPWL